MTVWKPKGSPFYYCSFVVKKQRFSGPTKLANERDARAFEKRWKAAEKRKLDLHGALHGRDMTMLDAVDRLTKEKVQQNGRAPYRDRDLDWLVEHIGPETKLSEIDAGTIAAVIEKRRQMCRWDDPKYGAVRGGTITQSVLRPLSALRNRAIDVWKIPLPDMPKLSMYFGEPYARTRELSIREELALLPECRDYRDLVEFILRSGLRRESALIRKSEVFLEEGRIKVWVKAKRNKKLLEIPITPAIDRIIRANIDNPTDFVFTYRKRTKNGVVAMPITSSGFFGAFKAAAARAGIADLVVHDLRRTAGARMYRATGNIAAVSKFLGHASVVITMKHYVHILPDDVSIAMRAAEAAHGDLVAKALANETLH
ncbi:tyrosine-type recombinase/integrase [Methylobacterium sp. 22177]|uniref:tyrosine-type recombinase/integrase n=1 Tax=Methylobacterium sp. 22177 TaxID=3453885 RepID=UPI003F84A95B